MEKATDSNARLDRTISQVSHTNKRNKGMEQKYPDWNKG